MASWNDPVADAEFIAALWADVEHIEEPGIGPIFAAANAVCVAFAPSLADGASVPDAWKIAEIMQAKHIWSRMRTGNRDSIGADGYEISTYPLVLEARGLLRPKRSPLKGLL